MREICWLAIEGKYQQKEIKKMNKNNIKTMGKLVITSKMYVQAKNKQISSFDQIEDLQQNCGRNKEIKNHKWINKILGLKKIKI